MIPTHPHAVIEQAIQYNENQIALDLNRAPNVAAFLEKLILLVRWKNVAYGLELAQAADFERYHKGLLDGLNAFPNYLEQLLPTKKGEDDEQ